MSSPKLDRAAACSGVSGSLEQALNPSITNNKAKTFFMGNLRLTYRPENAFGLARGDCLPRVVALRYPIKARIMPCVKFTKPGLGNGLQNRPRRFKSVYHLHNFKYLARFKG